MSDSVRPTRRQPTRLFCPWDSPDKNTGVGCHFLLQCMKVKKVKVKVAQSCPTLRDPMDCSPPGSSIHGILQARVLEWVASYYSKSYHSECCLWTGKPGVLQSLGSQRVRHDWATELTPGDHPDPAIEPISLAFTGRFFSTVPPGNLSPLKKKKNSETS